MKLRQKNKLSVKSILAVLFMLSMIVIVLSFYAAQTKHFAVEWNDFKMEIRQEAKENAITAKRILDRMTEELSYTATKIENAVNCRGLKQRMFLHFPIK